MSMSMSMTMSVCLCICVSVYVLDFRNERDKKMLRKSHIEVPHEVDKIIRFTFHRTLQKRSDKNGRVYSAHTSKLSFINF